MPAIMVLLGILLLLVPLPADASVTYQFLGITATLPPDPFHPTGVPPHFEAFTLTTPTFLAVPTSSPEQPAFLQITTFDSCLSCAPGLGVFLQNNIRTARGGIDSATIQFDDVVNVGYVYFFLPGAFATVGSHTTAQFDAVHESLGPFENMGTLLVTAPVPLPATLVLFGAGLGVALWRARDHLSQRDALTRSSRHRGARSLLPIAGSTAR